MCLRGPPGETDSEVHVLDRAGAGEQAHAALFAVAPFFNGSKRPSSRSQVAW